MKNFKKQFLIFALILSISLGSFYGAYKKPLVIVKASGVAEMISLFNLGLFSFGVNYYGNGSNNALQSDLEFYVRENNTSIQDFLSPFGTLIYNVGQNAIKFTKVQLSAIKYFIDSLSDRKKIGDDINNTYYVSDNVFYLNDVAYGIIGNNITATYGDFVFTLITSSPSLVFINHSSNLFEFNVGSLKPNLSNFSFTYKAYYKGSLVDEMSRVYIPPDHFTYKNGNLYCFTYPQTINKLFFPTTPEILKFNVNGVYVSSNIKSNNYSSYYVASLSDAEKDNIKPKSYTYTYQDNIAGLRDLSIDNDVVVTVPDIFDDAKNKAVERGGNIVDATDIASAIDDALIGSATVDDKANDDDSDDEVVGVITPTIPIELSQDDTIIDEFVSDDAIDDTTDPEPDPNEDDNNKNHSFVPLTEALRQKFPFSMLFNVLFIMNLFDADPIAPSFDLGFNFLGSDFSFIVDLSAFDIVARVLRVMELLSFIALLSVLSFKHLKS